MRAPSLVVVHMRPTRTIRCAFCHDETCSGDLLTCARCGTRRHADCGLRCPTLGCVARALVTERAPVALPLAAFALTRGHADFVAGRAPRPRFLATRARKAAGVLVAVAGLLSVVTASAVTSAIDAAARRDRFDAGSVATTGRVTTATTRRSGKRTFGFLGVEFRRDGVTSSFHADVSFEFLRGHPVGSIVPVRSLRELVEIVGQEGSVAREAETLSRLSLGSGLLLFGSACGAAVTVTRARRLDRDGTLRPGKVLSCTGYTCKGHFGIDLRYEISHENGRTTSHAVQEGRSDLDERTLPPRGTPLLALVAGGDHELL